jgi:hypothetical protein
MQNPAQYLIYLTKSRIETIATAPRHQRHASRARKTNIAAL